MSSTPTWKEIRGTRLALATVMETNDTPGILGVAMYALADTRLYATAEVGLVGENKHDTGLLSLWLLAHVLSSSGIPEGKWHEAVDGHEGHPQDEDGGAAGEGFAD
jgi:hypothetical protein